MKIIILAGGTGSRLWPLSRERYPKQFIKLNNRKYSLFQDTFSRSICLADMIDIYVVTNKNYKFLVIGEINELGYNYPEKNILIEPEAKNTLPAIYAGVHENLKRGGVSDSVVVFPSDHLIKRDEEFIEIIKTVEYLTEDSLVTFGITPSDPNTGYGYISPGEKKSEHGYAVKEFKEKPNHEKAVEYIQKGYFWNSGIFMFNSKVFLEEVTRYSPEIVNAFNTSKNMEEAFGKIKEKISIDYGIMEKSSRVAVVPVDIAWNDLGSFDSFYKAFQGDEEKNIAAKEHMLINSNNNIIYSEAQKLVVTIGIENLIIMDNKDALLVCSKDQSQKVKKVVDKLKNKKDIRVEYHVKDYRPWGNYEVLEDEKNCFKVKRIKVNPGEKISYQLHNHRNEHWVVVKGLARITINEQERILNPGESVDIKARQKHRVENIGELVLEIIEVQTGEYLEEDDIVRFDDEYGRR